MLIVINGPYEKYNQAIAQQVTKTLQSLYPNLSPFLYEVPLTELDFLACSSSIPQYNPFLHISSILSKIAIEVEDVEGENKPTNDTIRNYINRKDRLLITTDWYSSSIIRVLSYIKDNKPCSEANNKKLSSLFRAISHNKLTEFAFNLVKHFKFIPPDLNFIYLPNESNLNEDLKHETISTKTLTYYRSKQIKEAYKIYNDQIQDSYTLFNINGEFYDPIVITNQSNIVISDTVHRADPLSSSPESASQYNKYQSFMERMTKLYDPNPISLEQVSDEITSIISIFVRNENETNQKQHQKAPGSD